MEAFYLIVSFAVFMLVLRIILDLLDANKRTITTKSKPYDSPYRTAAEIPQEPPPIKPKRVFKMPSPSLGKHPKTFGYIVLICACVIGMGVAYDASEAHRIGDGLGHATIAAFAIMGLFLGLMAMHNATDGFR